MAFNPLASVGNKGRRAFHMGFGSLALPLSSTCTSSIPAIGVGAMLRVVKCGMSFANVARTTV